MYEGVGFALLILYYYHDYIHTETKLFNFQRIFKNGGGGGVKLDPLDPSGSATASCCTLNNISVKECTYACEEESPIQIFTFKVTEQMTNI